MEERAITNIERHFDEKERLRIDYLIEILYREHIVLEIERIAPYLHYSSRVQLGTAQLHREQQDKSGYSPHHPHLNTLLVL